MNILGVQISIDRSPTAKTKWTRRALIVGAANVAVITGGVAYASWTTTGVGAGAAKSGAVQPLTVAPGTVNSNVLYPTGTGDVVMTITNPNPFNVSVDSLSLPATAATAYSNAGLSTLNATCNSGGTAVTWNYATKSLTGAVVAKNGGTLTLTLTNGAQMGNASDNSCQSSWFQMANATATGTSSSAIAVSTSTQ